VNSYSTEVGKSTKLQWAATLVEKVDVPESSWANAACPGWSKAMSNARPDIDDCSGGWPIDCPFAASSNCIGPKFAGVDDKNEALMPLSGAPRFLLRYRPASFSEIFWGGGPQGMEALLDCGRSRRGETCRENKNYYNLVLVTGAPVVNYSYLRKRFSPHRLMKNLLRLAGILILPASLALASSPVRAQLQQAESTFTGSVPDSCTLTNGTQSVGFSLTGTTLDGTTGNITVNANGAVNLQLTAVTETEEAEATASPTATLNDITDSEDGIASSTPGAASSSVALGNQSNVDHNVTINMNVTGATAPGTYTYKVTLSCLAG